MVWRLGSCCSVSQRLPVVTSSLSLRVVQRAERRRRVLDALVLGILPVVVLAVLELIIVALADLPPLLKRLECLFLLDHALDNHVFRLVGVPTLTPTFVTFLASVVRRGFRLSLSNLLVSVNLAPMTRFFQFIEL